MIMPILCMRKHREVKQLLQGHTGVSGRAEIPTQVPGLWGQPRWVVRGGNEM